MLGPGNGTRRRHDQAAEHGLLVLHTPWGTGDHQRRRPSQQRERRDHQALKGLLNEYPLASLTGPSRLPQRAASGRP